mmetsp:Transcript_2461/g.4891  ORF Transcript_2461/g.4891 Transcript_2461/m.4891 type:complete len:221 (-) Transcript_2461:521-1183(-)
MRDWSVMMLRRVSMSPTSPESKPGGSSRSLLSRERRILRSSSGSIISKRASSTASIPNVSMSFRISSARPPSIWAMRSRSRDKPSCSSEDGGVKASTHSFKNLPSSRPTRLAAALRMSGNIRASSSSLSCSLIRMVSCCIMLGRSRPPPPPTLADGVSATPASGDPGMMACGALRVAPRNTWSPCRGGGPLAIRNSPASYPEVSQPSCLAMYATSLGCLP